MKTIIVTFSPDGEVKFEAVGFEGPDCVKETQVFEEALGQTKARTLKAHFHDQPTANTKLKRKLAS